MENLEILNYLEENIKNISFEKNEPEQKIIVEYFYIYVVTEIETKWKDSIIKTIEEQNYKFLDENIISKISQYLFKRYLSEKDINKKIRIGEIIARILLKENIDALNNKLFVEFITAFLNNKNFNSYNIKKDISILISVRNLKRNYNTSLLVENLKNSIDNDNRIWGEIVSERNKIAHKNYGIPIVKIIPTNEYFDFARKILDLFD